MSWI